MSAIFNGLFDAHDLIMQLKRLEWDLNSSRRRYFLNTCLKRLRQSRTTIQIELIWMSTAQCGVTISIDVFFVKYSSSRLNYEEPCKNMLLRPEFSSLACVNVTSNNLHPTFNFQLLPSITQPHHL